MSDDGSELELSSLLPHPASANAAAAPIAATLHAVRLVCLIVILSSGCLGPLFDRPAWLR
jgi:hypothetical protein